MSLISSVLGFFSADKQADASRDAGKLGYEASKEAIAEERRQFDIMRGYLDPVYKDSRAASSIYMQALGIPSMTGGGSGAPLPGSTLPANPQARPMTGGQFPGLPGIGNQILNMTPEQREQWAQLNRDWQRQQQGGQLPAAGQQPGGQFGPVGSSLDIGAQVRNTPGYQEQLEDGMTAIDRAAPLRGGMYSGRRMKALNDHGQRTFGSYYNDWMNRVGGMAGQASQVGGQIGNAGMSMAGNIGQNLMSGAAAQGAGKIGAANAWSGFMGDMAGKLSGFNAMRFMTGGM